MNSCAQPTDSATLRVVWPHPPGTNSTTDDAYNASCWWCGTTNHSGDLSSQGVTAADSSSSAAARAR